MDAGQSLLLFAGVLVTLLLIVTTINAFLDSNLEKEEANVKAGEALLEAQAALQTLETERNKYKLLLSQKKSSETRLGQITENLVPFLDGCAYDPKSMHFQGNPIDYVVYDMDAGRIVFLEVKSGNSKASKNQRTIKNIIQSGRVYYEEMRVNEKGIVSKKAKNAE